METDNFIVEKSQNPSRLLYLKTGLILSGILLLIHLGGQVRVPPLIDYRISLAVCIPLGILLFFGLIRAPITRSLKIDYQSQKIIVNYFSFWKKENLIEIPFNNFKAKVDKSFGVQSYGVKWKLYLIDQDKQVYSLNANEDGFREEQMNTLREKVQKIGKSR
ncbi:MAG: hypothetical protein K1X72_03350 [Pyrinomonadaceae bacterium]|nr:hypothetical protein [Pyrinomonadaceae bacterium]